MLTIAFRWRPTNTEWQYKTVITKKPPERWLADRLEAVKIGDVAQLDSFENLKSLEAIALVELRGLTF